MHSPTVLLTDLVLGESVRWHDGQVWFSDWVAGDVITVDSGERKVQVSVDGMPFCFDWLPDGRMVSTNGTHQRLLTLPSLATYADLAGLGVTSPWNDIAIDPRGNVFVNNIGYDFPGGEPASGFVAGVTPAGDVRRMPGDLSFPNGMAVSPDGDTLIVAESHGGRLSAFDIGPDGSLTGQRIWADLPGAAPDGVCFDASGAIWYADVPNQHCRRVREGGEVLDTVPLDRGGFDCALSPDGTLYVVTADFSDPGAMFAGARTGQLLSVEVTA
jgi:sugar lactone lactonase YvrE